MAQESSLPQPAPSSGGKTAEFGDLQTARGPVLWHKDPAMSEVVLEGFRTLRNKILSVNTASRSHRVFAITGAESTVGTSTVAFNLGLISGLEVQEEKTVIVDANPQNPTLHAAFNISQGPGLLDHLQQGAALHEIIHASPLPRLSLIPSGAPDTHSEVSFSPRDFIPFLETIRSMYDLVIIDTAPVLQSAQSELITSIADGTVLVVEAGRTRFEVVRATQEKLTRSGAKVVGAFLNKRRFVIPDWVYRYV
jgi:protein-tyrosine kinase